MQRFAQDLSLSGLGDRSCHSYYRQIRLISEHFDHVDPASLDEDLVRSYIIHLKSVKQWSPEDDSHLHFRWQEFLHSDARTRRLEGLRAD